MTRRLGPVLATLAICLCLTAASLGMGCSAPAPSSDAPEPDAWVTIGRARVATEIARTMQQKSRGLGQRDELAWDHGMLFPYPKPDFLAFWMKDMRFSIDIVWIRDGRVIGIAHRVPFDPEGGPGPTVRSEELADSVLEVPAGYAQAQGWRRGDRVEILEAGQRDETGQRGETSRRDETGQSLEASAP